MIKKINLSENSKDMQNNTKKTKTVFSQRREILFVMIVFFILTVFFILVNTHLVKGQAIVTIGTGTNHTSSSYPISRYFNYSCSELLYKNTEIGTTGDIDSIAFSKYSGTSGIAITNITIYMKMTSSDYLVSPTCTTSYTQVYTGSFPNTGTSGWQTLGLTTPFSYNDTSQNLAILIVHDYEAYVSTTDRPIYNSSSSSTSLCRYYVDDSNGWNCNKTMTNAAERPNIQLTFDCSSISAPAGIASQEFCDSATVNDLLATGSNIQWYSASTGGTPLSLDSSLVSGYHYYASQTITGCESINRLDVTVTINTSVPVSVTIEVDQDTVCEGTAVSFTATPANGGTPNYQWYVNGIMAGTDQPNFSYAPANPDTVYVVMTSSLSCVSGNPSISDTIIIMTVQPNLPVSVTIEADQDSVCEGTLVSFTATPVNEGIPIYQWYVNNIMAGTGQPDFSYAPANLDTVYVVMTSSLSCVSGNPAASDSIIMDVEICTSTETHVFDGSSLVIYPNPVSELLFVNFDQIKDIPVCMRIYDALGQLCFETKKPLQFSKNGIQLNSMNNGVHILQIVFENRITNQTFIIK
jgi:hypothetical protein